MPKLRPAQVTGFFVVLLVLLTLLAGALAVGSLVYPDLERGWQSRGWPSVTGDVIDHDARRAKGQTLTSSIRYAYTVHGKSFEGTRLSYVGVGYRQPAGTFDVGRTVRVFYDPGDPSEAVLFPGAISWRTVMAFLLVAFPGAATLGWILIGIRRLRATA